MYTYLATYGDGENQQKKLVRVTEKTSLFAEVKRTFGLATAESIELHADNICFREIGDLDWFPDKARILVRSTHEQET